MEAEKFWLRETQSDLSLINNLDSDSIGSVLVN